MFGLPDTVDGCAFDLDGVLTDTARVDVESAEAMFDPYL